MCRIKAIVDRISHIAEPCSHHQLSVIEHSSFHMCSWPNTHEGSASSQLPKVRPSPGFDKRNVIVTSRTAQQTMRTPKGVKDKELSMNP